MNNLLEKLQSEAGITAEQAEKVLKVVKNNLKDIDVDIDQLLKGKYDGLMGKAKGVYSNIAEQTDEYTDKLEDKIEDFADVAKKNIKNLGEKIVDLFDDNDVNK